MVHSRPDSWARLLMPALFPPDGTPWLPRTIMLFCWEPQTSTCAFVRAGLEVIKTAEKHINNDLMIRSTLCQNDDGKISFSFKECGAERAGGGS